MSGRLTDEQLDVVAAVAAPLFEKAVAQGLHAPFSLNCESWGREYAERLTAALDTDAYMPALRGENGPDSRDAT